MKTFTRVFVYWLPLTVAVSGVMLFAYVAVQQNYRQSANDPQIQLAEDGASSLATDYTPANLVSRNVPPVDLTTSLDTWTVVYDASGQPLESSAVLDSAPPQLPKGVFDTTTWKQHKTFTAPTGPETLITWQPNPDVRQAVVLVQFKTPTGVGYVAVGRSMHTLEDRIISLTQLFAVAWIVTVLATLFATVLFVRFL